MSISDTVKKVMPYLKTASGYVLHRLSSQAVEMDDGTTLEQKVTSLNSLISNKVDTSDVVNNCLTTEEGFVLDARQGKVLDDKITELNGNIDQKVNKNDIYDGETTLAGRANAVVSATLTFSDHGTVPRVFLTARASNPGNIRELSVSNITRTSMTINLYRTDAVDTPIQYLIIW